MHFDVSGDIPVTVIAWGAPKVGNTRMAEHAESLHPKLRVLRIRNPVDSVANRECASPFLEHSTEPAASAR